MRIAFWSNDSQCGTTSDMLAIAAMTDLLYPDVKVSAKRLQLNPASSMNIEKCLPNRGQEICFFDCGTGCWMDKRQILERMDLVVVNVRQDERQLDRFFMEDRFWLPDTLLLIGDYYGDFFADLRYLECRYRLNPQQFGVVFHNGAFGYSCCQGKLRHFIRKEYQRPMSIENERLILELERITRCMIHRCAEKKKEENIYGTGNETLWKCNFGNNRTAGIGRDSCGSTFFGRICGNRV